MRVVIAGGGFGGVKTALELAEDKRFHVTLVTDRDHMLYYPALYGTATGHSHYESVVPLSDIFDHLDNVRIVIDTVTHIDTSSRSIIAKNNILHYDTAILALGVVTTYFGITGLEENTYGIKSMQEIEDLKNHVHGELSQDHHLDKNYVVIGAGPTGVELAAALTTYLQEIALRHNVKRAKVNVTLVEAAPRVLPRMSEKASRLVEARLKKLGVKVLTNHKVGGATAEDILIDGIHVPSHTLIWTSGVMNNPFYKDNQHVFSLAQNGRVEVDEHLRAAPHVYVIGDNAATPFTGLAQTALHDAGFVADHLKRLVRNKGVKPYKPFKPPVVIPVGRNWAIFEWGRLTFGGALSSLLRFAADFIGYDDVLPFGKALGVWSRQFEEEERCATCKLALQER